MANDYRSTNSLDSARYNYPSIKAGPHDRYREMTPDSTVKIEGARFIITMDPERRIVRDGSLVVQGQNIIQVGKAEDLVDIQADRVIDAKDMVVTPGFVNGHMHISYAHATRGIFPDDLGAASVSYTHLTLPTILLV